MPVEISDPPFSSIDDADEMTENATVDEAFQQFAEAQREPFEKELRGRNRVLLNLAKGKPLAEVLGNIIEVAEEARPEIIASILVLDQQEGCLRHGASRQLPAFYLDAIDGVTPGASVGSCGTAAFTGKRVIVEDIQTSSLWGDYRELAARAKLRSCWSEPILAPSGRVIGTFATYYAEPRAPDDGDLQFVEWRRSSIQRMTPSY